MNTNTTADRIQTRVGTLNVRQHGAGSVAVLWPSLFIDSSSWQRVESRSLRTDGSFSSMVRAMVRAAIPVAATPTPTAQRRRWRYSTLLGSTDLSTRVGNAWGGHVGIIAASEWPDRLRSLVTLGTPVRAYRPAERRRVQLLTIVYRILGPAQLHHGRRRRGAALTGHKGQ